MDESAQKRYLDAEELAFGNTIKRVKEMLDLDHPVDERGFTRTFDVAFALGFMTAQLMYAQGFDISEVDTNESNIPI